MKKSTIILLLVFSVSNGFSQASPHFSLNLQFLGSSFRGGVNLQRDFVIDKYSYLSIGTGFGYGQNIIMTNQISYSTGIGKNYLELGLTGSYSDLRAIDFLVQKGYLIMPILGYRHISSEGVITRIHYSPIFQNGKLINYGGMSIGFYLRKNNRSNPSINTVRFTKI